MTRTAVAAKRGRYEATTAAHFFLGHELLPLRSLRVQIKFLSRAIFLVGNFW
jgi:hypothetical protein